MAYTKNQLALLVFVRKQLEAVKLSAADLDAYWHASDIIRETEAGGLGRHDRSAD